MRFSSIHKLTSYLMILSAVGSLLPTPELPTSAIVLTFVAIALSWFAEPTRFRLERYTQLWNIATMAFFFYLLTDVFRGGSVLNAGAYFLLFVLINKLFNRCSSKDYQQAYVISFLILVVATTLNTNLSYAVCFTCYTIFATWTLILLHLRREMEENYLLKHADGAQSEKVEVERILNSRRIIGGSFLAGTSFISLGVLLIAVMIFTFFPRIGFGLFIGHKRWGVAMVGFRERVKLGHHGVVRNNPNVVMRVIFPEGKPAGALRWRGSVYDSYEDGVWSHGDDLLGLMMAVTPTEGLYTMNHAPGLPWHFGPSFVRDKLLRQEIYLEPIDTSVIFAADRPVAVEIPRPVVGNRPFFIPRRGPLGEIRGTKMRTAGVRYIAYSQVQVPSPAQLRGSQAIHDHRWSRFLQLPDSLPARIGLLAQKITRGKSTIYDKVIAVQNYLRANYRYTLRLTHDKQYEPMDEFLFVTRRGHCEYFASAMTLMLRHVGVHTRQVNGFAGGAWNKIGNYYTVRQGDAHAWVEVLFSGIGWVTFDPTPSGSRPAPDGMGLAARLVQFVDTLRLRWFRYVVEYDLGKQAALLKSAQRLFRSPSSSSGWLHENYKTLAALGALLLCAIAFRWWWRRRSRLHLSDATSGHRPLPITALYQRMLFLLARAGYPKTPGHTPLEFVAELGRHDFEPVLLVDRFTHCYYDMRYGQQQLTTERTQELNQLLHKLGNSIDASIRKKKSKD